MMRAAKKLAGWEKTGLHPMLVNDPRVIDAEIALVRAAEAEKDDEEGEKILAPPAQGDRIGWMLRWFVARRKAP